MASRLGKFVLAAIGILFIASVWRMVVVEQEKRRLATAYEQAQQTLGQLQAERTHLSEELTGAHQTIEQQSSTMANIQQELKQLGDRLAQTTNELTALQQAHQQLQRSQASLLAEKQQLEAKLSSIQELKLAIRDVKRKLRDERLAAWQAHVEAMKAADQRRLALGNRGYLVRDGVPTVGARASLHVRVLEPQSQ